MARSTRIKERGENKMKTLRTLTALGAAVAGLCLVANAQTNQWEKRTILTVNAPIEIPGHVLPAGTYVMRLNNSPADRHIVEVYDKDQQHLITTILAIPNYRLQPTGKTVFSFWEVPQGQPKALRAWFYPGDNFGQEFAYPKQEATKIAAYTHTAVPTTSAQSTQELATAPVNSTNESGASSDLDRNTYAAPPQSSYNTPAQAAEAERAPVPPAPAEQAQPNEPVQTAQAAPREQTPQTTAPAPAQLPATGSNVPLVGLVGLVLLALAGFVKVLPIRVR